jgi:predicted transcriptional regulator
MTETINQRISIRHLRAFATVSREGNQTKAAQLLCVTQAALSLTIQKLEEDLSVTRTSPGRKSRSIASLDSATILACSTS